MKTLRLLLVDDQPVVREGLRALLGRYPQFEIVGEASDGAAAVDAAERLAPDIVVMDVGVSGTIATQLVRQLKAQVPAARTLAFTVREEGGYLRSVLDAGASGYVLKRSTPGELVRALEVIGGGGTYLDSSMTELLVSSLPHRRGVAGQPAPLSEREREVVRSVAHGFSNREIAGQLAVSVKTVETYRYRAVEKLGLRTRADLVRYAIGQGWLGDHDGWLASPHGSSDARPSR